MFSLKSNLKARKSIWNVAEIDDLIGEERKVERKLDLKWIPVSIYFLKSSIAALSALGQFSGFERWTLCETTATWGASAPGLKFDASIHWTNREPVAIHAVHSLAKLCHSIEKDVNNWSLVFSRRNRYWRLGDLQALISPNSTRPRDNIITISQFHSDFGLETDKLSFILFYKFFLRIFINKYYKFKRLSSNIYRWFFF